MSEASEMGATGDMPGTEKGPRDDRFTVSQFNDLPLPVRVMAYGSLAVVLLLYFLYPAFPTTQGTTLAGWTWYGCNPDNGFLHGRFVPLAFAVMIWMAHQRTKDQVARPSYAGLLWMLLAIFFYLVSIRTIQPRVALVGTPFMVIGFTHYLFGFSVTRHVIFPAFFLWFAIPVPGLETLLTGRLQILITKACYHVGTFVGMDLVNVGSNIFVGESKVKVAEGCSGIRSLMALTMIAAVYGNYTQKPLWKKAFLFLSAFPLAIIANFLRVFTILVLAQFGFEGFAVGTWHDWAGLLFFFPIALAGLYLVDYLLNFRSKRSKRVKRSVRKTRTMKPKTATE